MVAAGPTSLRSLRELRLGKPVPQTPSEASEGCRAEALSGEGGPPLPTKISKTTPCKVAAGRWHGRFTRQKQFDTSGKSAARFHHRPLACFSDHQTSSAHSIRRESLLFDRRIGGLVARNGRTSIFNSMVEWPTNGRPCLANGSSSPPSSKKVQPARRAHPRSGRTAATARR